MYCFFLVISPHRVQNTDVGYSSSQCACASMYVCVGQDREPCKNGRTERDAVWCRMVDKTVIQLSMILVRFGMCIR